MIKHWEQWSTKWQALSKRERLLLQVTFIVVPVLLIFVLLIEQPLKTFQKTPLQINNLEKELSHQKRLLEMLEGQTVKDPNIAARKELRKLRKQLAAENEKVRLAAENLVSPQQMLTLLRAVLENENGAELQIARSLPVETVQLGEAQDVSENASSTKTEEAPSALIYRHPFEVEIKGSYQGVFNYLKKVENLDGVFFWDLLEYSVQEHPKAAIKIRIHTLSYEAGWLGA